MGIQIKRNEDDSDERCKARLVALRRREVSIMMRHLALL